MYTSVPSPENLSRYIRRFLVADCKEPIDLSVRAKPTGYVYLGWIFRGSIRSTVDNQPMFYGVGPAGFHISGQIQNQEINLKYAGACGHVMAEFTALGFFQLSGMHAARFTGLSLHLERAKSTLANELKNSAAPALCKEAEQLGSDACLRVLQEFLARLAQSPHHVPKYLEKAVALIENNHGAIKVADVAAAAGISNRQLNRTFLQFVGVPPKYFCRVLQMNRALQAMKENDTVYLTELAQLSGYFDQSHFNRAIAEFFADSPSEFLARDETMLFELLGESRKY